MSHAEKPGGTALKRAPRFRLLVNCSNLHVGGAVAVAASFINSLSREPDPGLEVGLLMSSAVAGNLDSLGTDLSGFVRCEVVDYRGLRSLWSGLSAAFTGFDVIFTVFGPAYTVAMGSRHVCGFAQPLIIYPNNPVVRRLPLVNRVVQLIKYKVQELFFARADAIVVELEHVQTALKRKALFRSMPIHIVYNAVDTVFLEPDRWLPVSMPDPMPGTAQGIRLGVVSRNYLHKNLDCLPALKAVLEQRHKLSVEFVVTFTDEEWQSCSNEFRRTIHNAGALVLAQSPSFYAGLDGVLFPSLLECFSAVPLEAMLMRRPLFASDLPFIRDCCHDHAHYFNPLDVGSMARVIADYYQQGRRDEQLEALERARHFVQRYPSPDDRARAYLAIARDMVARTAE